MSPRACAAHRLSCARRRIHQCQCVSVVCEQRVSTCDQSFTLYGGSTRAAEASAGKRRCRLVTAHACGPRSSRPRSAHVLRGWLTMGSWSTTLSNEVEAVVAVEVELPRVPLIVPIVARGARVGADFARRFAAQHHATFSEERDDVGLMDDFSRLRGPDFDPRASRSSRPAVPCSLRAAATRRRRSRRPFACGRGRAAPGRG